MNTIEPVPAAQATKAEPTPVNELVKSIVSLGLGAEPYGKNADSPAVQASAEHLFNLMRELHGNPEFCFDLLSSHTVVDRIEQNSFELLYYLHSLTHQKRLLVSVMVPRDNPIVPTISPIWKIAEWQEREVYDLFGVYYDNHPDLRRIFLEDEWKGFPLRKDYQDDFMLTNESKESNES